MSAAIATASRLKPQFRLAQAVSQFEADLPDEKKDALRANKLGLQSNPPVENDVAKLIAEIDRTSAVATGRRCFGPRLQCFLNGVQNFAALGDVVVGDSHSQIACSIWILVRMSLLSITAYASCFEKLSRLFMVVGRSAPCYQTMALLYPYSMRLQADLAEYFIVVVDFCQKIWTFATKSPINKGVFAFSDSDLETYQSDLERWANTIRVHVLTESKAHEDDNDVKTLLTKNPGFASHQRNLQTKFRVLNLCSTYDFQTAWKQIRKLGRCSFLSHWPEYSDWKDQAGPSTMAVTGKLGSGKSVLLASIVDDLNAWMHPESSIVIYHFCQHDVPESLKPRSILGSLARQMLLTIPELALSKGLPDETTLNLDLEGIYDLVQRVFPRTKTVYLVLDGFQECEFPNKAVVLEQIHKLQKAITLKICLSIRHDTATNLFLGPKDFVVDTKIFLPDDNPDVEIYIREELTHLVSSEKLKLGDPLIIPEIQKKILERSQGVFLWVALQLQSLCSMKTDSDIRHALENLPKDLPETYSRILEKSAEHGKAEQRRVLQLVSVAFRPLKKEELREALSVEAGDADWHHSKLIPDVMSMLACCGGLVLVDEEEETARLVHHSLKQFLFGVRRPGCPAFTGSLVHRDVADTIITYLNYGVFSRRDEHLIDRFPFYDYAKSFCMQHIISAAQQEPFFEQLTLRWLDKNKSNVNVVNEDGQTSLSWAADNGHEAQAKLLLGAGADVMTKDRYGLTPLLRAAGKGHKVVVKLLLEAKADVEARDKSNMTPLLRAAINGEEAVVKLLLEASADVEAKDYYNQTPLSRAAVEGHEEVVRLLLEAKADVETKDNKSGLTPLLWATVKENEAVVKLLLEAKADVEAKDTKNGQTPLSWAAKKGCKALVTLLLEVKGDVEATDADNRTPLSWAAERGHDEVVKLLLEAKANVRAKGNKNKRTPLLWAALKGNKAVVKLLLETDADIEAKDNFGFTPLLRAVDNGHEAVVTLLLEFKADVEAKDNYNRTALSWASAKGYEAVARLLLDAKADVEVRDINNGRTALLWAAIKGHKGVVKLLLEFKANVEAKDNYNRTALSWAAEQGYEVVVRLLLEAKADVGVKDNKNGRTPLMWATLKGHEAVVKLLKSTIPTL